MGRNKSKTTRTPQPNAPELTIHSHQPAHNPYYPDPSAAALLSSPPPPYSDLTVPISSASAAHYHPQAVPMAQMHTVSNNINYPRLDHGSGRGQTSVVIQSAGVPYDRRADRYIRKVRSFNNQTILIAILAIVLSIWSYNLYERRTCIYSFTVLKPAKDVTVNIGDVRNFHLNIAYCSGFIILLCLLKAATGWNSKSYSCYLFLIGLATFVMTLMTGYLAYLSFYSPCVPSLEDIASKAGKTIIGYFTDKLPAPENGVFGETSVFRHANKDEAGVLIFILDVVNFVFYFAVFLSSTILC